MLVATSFAHLDYACEVSTHKIEELTCFSYHLNFTLLAQGCQKTNCLKFLDNQQFFFMKLGNSLNDDHYLETE